MSTDPNAAPVSDPEVKPSSTPDGPQVVPAPDTPEGEPGPDPAEAIGEFDNREANPNSGGPLGLQGEMGISSERTGPGGPDPRGTDTGIQGTGSRGGALVNTDGEGDTRPTRWDAVDVSQGELAEHETEDTDGAARRTAVTDDSGTWQGIDRTVGEPKPDGIEDEKLRRQA